jgi:hypothetical protein
MDEHDPVGADEFVYRRIHRTFFDSSVQVPIQFPAFRPNQNDTTGISLFRAGFLQPADTLADIDPSKAGDYYVVRLAVSDLRRLGLTVVPEPLSGGPPGHAVIQELTWATYQGRKQYCKPILVELAKLASADIVHQPGKP